jgi:hypothetical protein
MHNVNNPSGDGDTATMSSYCLTLMAIAYLQHMGMLPNLQARVEAPKQHNNADTTDCHDVVWTGWGRYQGTKARIRYDKRPPPGWQPTRSMTASEAVAGFFAYFSQPSGFKYESEILSVLNGGVIKRAHLLGQYAAERKAVRNGLIAEGRSADDVRLTMEAFDMERDARNDPSFMGKGNSDIQPRQWGEKRLVVQDPFIWEKVSEKRSESADSRTVPAACPK